MTRNPATPSAPRTAERSTDPLSAADRAAVEPVAALFAVAVVGLALGLCAGAFADAAPDRSRETAEAVLDRVERATAVGGVVDPDRLRRIEDTGRPTTVELEAGGERWLTAPGPDVPGPPGERSSEAVAVAERRVTVRVAPGENVRGTLRAVVWE